MESLSFTSTHYKTGYSPTIVNTTPVDPVLPAVSVAVHVWVPLSPEWTAAREIIATVEVLKTQPLQVDDHW